MFQSEVLLELFERWPRIGWAFWWLSGREQAILQQRLAVLGRRNAYERAAYLIWELCRRLELAGYAPDPAYRLPLAGELLADALSLTPVHRTLRRLQGEGYISLALDALSVEGLERLGRLALGNENCLMLNGTSEKLGRRLS